MTMLPCLSGVLLRSCLSGMTLSPSSIWIDTVPQTSWADTVCPIFADAAVLIIIVLQLLAPTNYTD